MAEGALAALMSVAGLYFAVRAVLAWPADLRASLTPVGYVVAACVLFMVLVAARRYV